jgi:hypothetical protein
LFFGFEFGKEEPTLFTVFDLDCDADVILGFPWLRSHGLAFVYEDSQICFCAEAGCTSGRRVRMDLAQASATPAEASSVLRGPALLRMIREAGLEFPTVPRPSLWTPQLPGASATLTVAAAGEDWASGVLASLAAGERVLRDGTALFYGSFILLTEDLSFSLPAETEDPPDFSTLAAEYAAVRQAFYLTGARNSSCASTLETALCPGRTR